MVSYDVLSAYGSNAAVASSAERCDRSRALLPASVRCARDMREWPPRGELCSSGHAKSLNFGIYIKYFGPKRSPRLAEVVILSAKGSKIPPVRGNPSSCTWQGFPVIQDTLHVIVQNVDIYTEQGARRVGKESG